MCQSKKILPDIIRYLNYNLRKHNLNPGFITQSANRNLVLNELVPVAPDLAQTMKVNSDHSENLTKV